jgi:hypothetical protein
MDGDALERIAEKLRRAREMDAQPFGLESHGMRINPPLPVDDVAAVEARLGVMLPEEYRGFITRISDGGAGPAYGMFPLDKALRLSRLDRMPELLAHAFPHVDHYDPDKDPEVLDFYDRADAGEISEAEADARYHRLRGGTLELCDEGCGYTHFLVVTGPARGTMWIDSRAGDAGFIPLNATFLQWYERWLDDALAGGHGTWWLGPPDLPPG